MERFRQDVPISLSWSIRATLFLLVITNVSRLWSGPQGSYTLKGRYQIRSIQEARQLTSSQHSKPLCSREQVQAGSWYRVQLERPPYIVQNVSKLLCVPWDRYTQDHFDSWEWKPYDESCEFTPWSKELFCDLVRDQSILFMGDSLTQEAMFALGELLGLRRSPDRSKQRSLYDFQGACNGTVEAIFRREDFLRPSKVAWELQDRLPAVAVLNRGAHYVEDDELMRDINATIAHIRTWQSRCADLGRKCLLVWRTTVPGHPKCPDFNQPTANRSHMESIIDAHPISKRYHWHDFQRQNLLIEKALSVAGIEYEMLDAYYINILRPDEHRVGSFDCLHSCLGSKLDVYAQVLAHILRRQALENLLEGSTDMQIILR